MNQAALGEGSVGSTRRWVKDMVWSLNQILVQVLHSSQPIAIGCPEYKRLLCMYMYLFDVSDNIVLDSPWNIVDEHNFGMSQSFIAVCWYNFIGCLVTSEMRISDYFILC